MFDKLVSVTVFANSFAPVTANLFAKLARITDELTKLADNRFQIFLLFCE
jgi:hypothetical protein